MGNLQQHCRGVADNLIELDSPDQIYLPNETISGKVSHLKHKDASVRLIGTIAYKKRKRNGLCKCQIPFFSTEFSLVSSSEKKQRFQLHLDEHLPPSFHHRDTYPNITYSIHLLYANTKEQIHASIPISVCPRTQVDRPLLSTPLFFGPVENPSSGIKLDVKINRAVFTFDDMIQIFYELQNPQQTSIEKTEISLGIYYVIDSNVWQEDVSTGMETFSNELSKNKLIRNKALLNIPNKIYLPPTFKFQYGHEGDLSSFRLSIDYKIQMKIYFGETHSLWQVDIPIVLCNDRSGSMEEIPTTMENEEEEEEIEQKTEILLADVDTNVNITE